MCWVPVKLLACFFLSALNLSFTPVQVRACQRSGVVNVSPYRSRSCPFPLLSPSKLSPAALLTIAQRSTQISPCSTEIDHTSSTLFFVYDIIVICYRNKNITPAWLLSYLFKVLCEVHWAAVVKGMTARLCALFSLDSSMKRYQDTQPQA